MVGGLTMHSKDLPDRGTQLGLTAENFTQEEIYYPPASRAHAVGGWAGALHASCPLVGVPCSATVGTCLESHLCLVCVYILEKIGKIF